MDYNIYLTYDYSPLTWVLAGITLCCLLYTLIFTAIAFGRVYRRVEDDQYNSLPSGGYPPLSIIICVGSDTRELESLLNDIFSQDYPAETEVIVVTDGSSSEAERIVGSMQREYSNLYLTFTPADSRNLSRHKLAITLGVKAARFDAVVLTECGCRADSQKWLRYIGRHFAAGKEVVVGFVHPDDNNDQKGACRVRAFDKLWQSISWLSPAIRSYPRCGLRGNLAYTRRLFFSNKGFSRTLNLKYGDDDIFISEIASRSNSIVELAPDSQLRMVDDMGSLSHQTEKLQRMFTHSRIDGSFRFWLSLLPWMLWIMIASTIAVSITTWPSLIATLATLLMTLSGMITLSFIWRKTALSLRLRPLLITVTPLMLWHPFYQLGYLWRTWKHRKSNFTWSN